VSVVEWLQMIWSICTSEQEKLEVVCELMLCQDESTDFMREFYDFIDLSIVVSSIAIDNIRKAVILGRAYHDGW